MNWLQKTASKKIMIIVRGPSGSGKSTLVKDLSKIPGSEVFSSDDFFMNEGQYRFNPKQLAEAHEITQERVRNAALMNVPVIIVDNTNTQFWEMRPYVEIALDNDYQIIFKEPNWHKDLRNDDGTWNIDFLNRQQQNVDRVGINKIVPDEVIKRTVDRYQYNPSIEAILQAE